MSWTSIEEDNDKKCSSTLNEIQQFKRQLEAASLDPHYERFIKENGITGRIDALEKQVQLALVDLSDLPKNKTLIAEVSRLKSQIRNLNRQLEQEKSKFQDARMDILCLRECIALLKTSSKQDAQALAALAQMDSKLTALLQLCGKA